MTKIANFLNKYLNKPLDVLFNTPEFKRAVLTEEPVIIVPTLSPYVFGNYAGLINIYYTVLELDRISNNMLIQINPFLPPDDTASPYIFIILKNIQKGDIITVNLIPNTEIINNLGNVAQCFVYPVIPTSQNDAALMGTQTDYYLPNSNNITAKYIGIDSIEVIDVKINNTFPKGLYTIKHLRS